VIAVAPWRRLVRLWRLSRGWTYIPPPDPALRPLYSPGTQARIDRLRALYSAPADARHHALVRDEGFFPERPRVPPVAPTFHREPDIAIPTAVH